MLEFGKKNEVRFEVYRRGYHIGFLYKDGFVPGWLDEKLSREDLKDLELKFQEIDRFGFDSIRKCVFCGGTPNFPQKLFTGSRSHCRSACHPMERWHPQP